MDINELIKAINLKKKRQVFFSFHFDNDFWRTQQVRNIGVIEGNTPVSKNDWEEVKEKGQEAIEKWIEDNLKYKSCTVVLVGYETANRPWVRHEIVRSWNLGKGVVGIRIHNLKDQNSQVSTAGTNPFFYITIGSNEKKMSEIVKLYDPPTISIFDSTNPLKYLYEPQTTRSQIAYNHISENISNWIDEAIRIRNSH